MGRADMKSLFLALLTCVIIPLIVVFAIATAQTETRQSFDDVPLDHWAYEEIELIFSHGITVGCSYDPPLYCPERPMTRAEAAVFAARILEIIEQNK